MHVLESRIDSLRRRVFWARCLNYYAAGLARIVAAVSLFCIIDSRSEEDWVAFRWVGFAVILAVISGTVWRLRRQLQKATDSRVATAQRIESFFPDVRGYLANAIQFLQVELPGTSRSLQRIVVEEASRRTEKLMLHKCLRLQPTLGLAGAYSTIVLMGVIWVSVSPARVSTHLQRLFLPWETIDRPPSIELVWENQIERIAVGDPLDITVANRVGLLPERVTILYRRAGTRNFAPQRREMKRKSNRMTYRFNRLNAPVELRFVSGKYQSEWMLVDVVRVPNIEDFRFHILPPEYTGVDTIVTPIRAPSVFAGTRIGVSGRMPGERMDLTLVWSHGKRSPLALDADGTFLLLPKDGIKLETSTEYWFEAVDESGLKLKEARRWGVRVDVDKPPTTSLRLPPGSKRVVWPVKLQARVLAQDDVTLKRVGVEVSVRRREQPGETETSTIETTIAADEANQPVEEVIDVDLANTSDLKPGDEVGLRSYATDSKGQTTFSARQLVAIVSNATWKDDVYKQRLALIQQLERAIELQQQTMNLTSQWLMSMESARAKRNSTDQIVFQQNEVMTLLVGNDSVLVQAKAMLDQLRQIRTDGLGLEYELKELVSELGEIHESAAPRIREILTRLRVRRPEDADLMKQLNKAQQQLYSLLVRQLNPLSRSTALREQADQLLELLKRQKAILERTRTLQFHAVNQEVSKMEVNRLWESQESIGLEWQRLESSLRKVSRIEAVLNSLDSPYATSGLLAQATSAIKSARFGNAAVAQSRVLASWDQLFRQLTDRRPQENKGQKQERSVDLGCKVLLDEQVKLRDETAALIPNRVGMHLQLLDRQLGLLEKAKQIRQSDGVTLLSSVALRRVERAMQAVVTEWKLELSAAVLQRQQNVVDLLKKITGAADANSVSTNTQASTEQNDVAAQHSSAGSIDVRELKLAIEMQRLILQETQEIEQRRVSGQRTAQDVERLVMLADEQQLLAEFFKKLRAGGTQDRSGASNAKDPTVRPDINKQLDQLIPGFQ